MPRSVAMLAGTSLLAGLLMTAGCSAASRTAAEATAAPTVTATPGGEGSPLASLAGRRVIVLPVQRVEGIAGPAIPGRTPLADALDGEVAFALDERGLGDRWVAASALRRMAAQNPSMGLEPDALPLPAEGRLRAGNELLEPLAGQLRSLAALADARYAILPLKLAVGAGPADSGTTRAVLHLLLVDVRTAQLLWAGESQPAEAPSGSPALAARVASRFVDLIAPPGAP